MAGGRRGEVSGEPLGYGRGQRNDAAVDVQATVADVDEVHGAQVARAYAVEDQQRGERGADRLAESSAPRSSPT